MSQWSQHEEGEIIAEVCRRSAVDGEFRKLALKDPLAALAKVTTKEPPPDVSYRFVDNSGSVRTIPLPDFIPDPAELSDTELEQIAGGNYASQAGYTGG